MILVIDESGNPASLLVENASDSLCVTAVCIENHQECEKLRESIREFLHSTGHDLTNFKYSKASNEHLRKFIEEVIAPSNIKFYSFYQNKVNHQSGSFKMYFDNNENKREYYLELSGSLSRQLKSITNVEVLHDSFGWPETKNMINEVYVDNFSKNGIKLSKFEFCDSKKEELILLPDILSGLVRDVTEMGANHQQHEFQVYLSDTLKEKMIGIMALIFHDFS